MKRFHEVIERLRAARIKFRRLFLLIVPSFKSYVPSQKQFLDLGLETWNLRLERSEL
jgi:hypothetical protein